MYCKRGGECSPGCRPPCSIEPHARTEDGEEEEQDGHKMGYAQVLLYAGRRSLGGNQTRPQGSSLPSARSYTSAPASAKHISSASASFARCGLCHILIGEAPIVEGKLYLFSKKQEPAAAVPKEGAAVAGQPISAEKILGPALTKLQKDAAGRYGNPQVKKAAEDALAELARQQGNADTAFGALQVAVASKTPKYSVTALDCMEKLLAHKLLGKTPEMASKVIKVISACSEQPDDGVQLQVVKALLTAVTAGIAHESSLLLALRACYHIHLETENAVNRTTSKISLTQMVSWVITEVENQDSSSQALNRRESASVTPPTKEPSPQPSPVPSEPSSEIQVTEKAAPEELPFGEAMYPSIQVQLGFSPSEQGSTGEVGPDTTAGNASAVSSPSGVSASNLEEIAKRQAEEDDHQQNNMRFTHPAHKDAFLVLRTLSKLSTKEISFEDITATGEEKKPDAKALKTKLLSLDLLRTVMEQAGPQFKSERAILFAIKQYLMPALMKNCLEVNTQVADVSIRVFELLHAKFKDQLKKEVELIISTVFLGILDSPHASIENRVLVLDTLTRMCLNIGTMVEIFLNYDCDWNSQDLLRQISETLCKVALTRMSQNGESDKMVDPELSNAKRLRVLGAKALAGLIKSLASYAKVEANDPEPTSESNSTAKGEEDNPQSTTRLASAALDSFQLKQTWKRDRETAIQKFNEKPKEGIKFLRERGHLDTTPQSTARFLYENQSALSKTQIGDYLGDSGDVNKDVLYAYTDLFDFKGLKIDEAIRVFLGCFRIPGEAQKIDRIMEKFAHRYWIQNQDTFPSADTAFILSYAIIMLQTDAHNPNIKPEKKMKKEDFLRNNRGIASGRDLAPEYLGAIYDSIVAKPITLTGDDSNEQQTQIFADPRSKRKAFFKERAEILQMAEQKRKGVRPNSGPTATMDEKEAEAQSYTFFMVEHSYATSEHVAPMFVIIWTSLMTAFNANLLNTDEPEVATLCLDGLYNSIRVAGRFNLDDERAALIDQLAVLTRLDNPLDIEPKSVMCVQALTALAVTEGNYMGSSWPRVLQCISELARLLLLSPTGEDDSVQDGQMFNTEPPIKKRNPAPVGDHPLHKATHALKRVLDFSAVDRIFTRSTNLNEDAIVEFVAALTEVSRSELLLKPPVQRPVAVISKKSSSTTGAVAPIASLRPRLFSLQKIVEVADFNIDMRPRLTWNRVWEKLSEHFVASGCHPSSAVALYAVDSLKQLSVKFLNKEEFEGFAFQDRFLRPFEAIVQKAGSAEVRALVLHCMQNFIVSRSKSIKSGWGAVFDTIAASSKDAVKENMMLGYSLLEVAQQFHAPAFLFAQGALKFAYSNDASLSTKCIEIVEGYAGAAYLPDTPVDSAEDMDSISPTKARELLKGLAGFATRDPRENVRRQALASVFTILKQALEDRAEPTIVSKIFMSDVMVPWTTAFSGPVTHGPTAQAISFLVAGPKWPFSTLAFMVIECVKFLSLALYELEVSADCTPEEFSRQRSGGPEDEPVAPVSGKGSSHPRENAFAQLLESSLHLFEILSSTPDRAVAAVGIAAYHYCIDVLGNHFSSKTWRVVLGSLSNALKRTSPAQLNTHEAMEALGLVIKSGNDSDDETKIQSVSLDDLSKDPDAVFLPVAPPKRSPKAAATKESAEETGQQASTNGINEEKPALPDIRAAEVHTASNIGLVKVVCRIIKRPIEKHDVLAKACDILEQALSDASAFDDNHPLRIELSRRGMLKEGAEKPPREGIIPPVITPDALEVEVLSAQTLLKHMQIQGARDEARFERVLVGLVNRYLRQDRILAAEQTFKPKTVNVVANLQPSTRSESEKELLALTPVVLFALRGVLELEGTPVDRALPWVFPLLLQLIECPNRDVRAIVRRILEKHLTPRMKFG